MAYHGGGPGSREGLRACSARACRGRPSHGPVPVETRARHTIAQPADLDDATGLLRCVDLRFHGQRRTPGDAAQDARTCPRTVPAGRQILEISLTISHMPFDILAILPHRRKTSGSIRAECGIPEPPSDSIPLHANQCQRIGKPLCRDSRRTTLLEPFGPSVTTLWLNSRRDLGVTA